MMREAIGAYRPARTCGLCGGYECISREAFYAQFGEYVYRQLQREVAS